jgi:hypothetical protein
MPGRWLTSRRTSCCRRELRFEPRPPLSPERRDARARDVGVAAADLFAAAAPPLSARPDAPARALVFGLRAAPLSAPSRRGPLLIGDGYVFVDVHAEALGDPLELLILLYQGLELAQALCHSLFGAAELVKNGQASFHDCLPKVYHSPGGFAQALKSKLDPRRSGAAFSMGGAIERRPRGVER